MIRLRFIPVALLAAAGLPTLFTACGEPGEHGTIPPEAFVQTWVELRTAALSAEDQTLTDSARADVLERMGVTEEELVTFAEVHGSDLDFMRSVWDSVAARLDSTQLGTPPGVPAEPRDPGGAPPSSR